MGGDPGAKRGGGGDSGTGESSKGGRGSFGGACQSWGWRASWGVCASGGNLCWASCRGIRGVGHAAAAGMAHAQQGQFTTFNNMIVSHAEYTNLVDAETQAAFLRVRAGVKPTPTEAFKDGPGDLTVLARSLQTVLRLATVIMVDRHYGPNEELGLALVHSAFDGDALSLSRKAFADTPPSDGLQPGMDNACSAFRPTMCHCRTYCVRSAPCQEARSDHMGHFPPDPGGCCATLYLITLDHIGALFHGCPQCHYEGRYEPAVNG